MSKSGEFLKANGISDNFIESKTKSKGFKLKTLSGVMNDFLTYEVNAISEKFIKEHTVEYRATCEHYINIICSVEDARKWFKNEAVKQ